MTENESVSEHAAPPSGASLLMIDTLVFQLLPRGYAWPASALTGFDMQRLNEIKEATRKPVTELLRDAVDLLYEATASERAELAQQKSVVRRRVRKTVAGKSRSSPTKRGDARSLFADTESDESPPEQLPECNRPLETRPLLKPMADVVATSESLSNDLEQTRPQQDEIHHG